MFPVSPIGHLPSAHQPVSSQFADDDHHLSVGKEVLERCPRTASVSLRARRVGVLHLCRGDWLLLLAPSTTFQIFVQVHTQTTPRMDSPDRNHSSLLSSDRTHIQQHIAAFLGRLPDWKSHIDGLALVLHGDLKHVERSFGISFSVFAKSGSARFSPFEVSDCLSLYVRFLNEFQESPV